MVSKAEIKSRNKEFNYLVNDIKSHYEPGYIRSMTDTKEMSAYCQWVCSFKDLKGIYAIKLHENCKLSVWCTEWIACPIETELEVFNPLGSSLTSLLPCIIKTIRESELHITKNRNKIIQAKRQATIARRKVEADGR